MRRKPNEDQQDLDAVLAEMTGAELQRDEAGSRPSYRTP
jgi:hypothetical protein